MSPAEELPQELWTQILSALTWRHRLSVCALVCQKLRRAAAAATQEVHVWAPDSAPQRANDFLSWTSSYGSSLTALHLDFGVRGGSVRQLAACPNLVQLKLVGCSVQLGAGSGDMGLLHSCTALTHLVLSNVTLLDVGLDKPAAGMAAAPVARLQSLALRSCDLPDGPEGPQQTAQVLRECLVPHLASLTHFELHFSLLYSALMHHLSTMVRLEQLSLRGAGSITAASVPGIGGLTALKDLHLRSCVLEPSCLLPTTTGLTRFKLEDVGLSPLQAEQDGETGGSQLLQLLARLPALQSLRLADLEGYWPQQLSAHSALTASSNLQELEVCRCYIQDAAWQYVFPAGRKLPGLHWFDTHDSGGRGAVLCSTAIAGLAACCPALRDLAVAADEYACLTPLESLTALSGLVLCPVGPTEVRDLPRLTQLKSLELYVAVPPGGVEGAVFGLPDLVRLTALTGLEHLDAWVFEEQHEEEEEVDIADAAENLVCLRSRAEAGSPPDVWQQLLQDCAADQVCAPAVTGSILQQLTQLRQEHKQELAAARAEAAAAAAKAAAEAAELRGQMHALQGQLQEVLAAVKQRQP